MNIRPYVTLSYAQSLDGRIADRNGVSQWISGEESLQRTHELRDQHDAILTGIRTVLCDNPRLTCRLPGGKNPIRIILDSKLRIPNDSIVVRTAREIRTQIFCGSSCDRSRLTALEQAGITVVPVQSGPSGLILSEILATLYEKGIRSILVEGGAAVITSFIREKLADSIILFIAPLIIGTGTDAVGDLGTAHLGEAMRGKTASVCRLGEDIVWEVRLNEQG
jgi:5-amino-6-(5-phosphoribosylamino)uracil reductase/diaminohydroxyphosphoribosylaminopyrimidine deaminase/5-amino-6-(5-phosphoribosylamino)uracil reductase